MLAVDIMVTGKATTEERMGKSTATHTTKDITGKFLVSITVNMGKSTILGKSTIPATTSLITMDFITIQRKANITTCMPMKQTITIHQMDTTNATVMNLS